MRTIIVTYGLPAAGKDFWAKEEMRRYPNRYKRVNKDMLRAMLDNADFSYDNEKFMLSVRDSIVEKSLRRGFDVIVSDTNFPMGGRHFLRMCEIAQKVGDVTVAEKFFDVTVKEALARNHNADRTAVPDDVIYTMYDKHVKNKFATAQTVYFPPLQPLENIHGLKPAVVCDIDGTLAIKGDRSPYDWKNVGVDAVNQDVAGLFGMLGSGITKIIISGRDGSCRAETEKWLDDNCISYDVLLMRTTNDNRKDSVIKRELYEANIKDKYNVLFCLDDRDSVVELWRSLGLTCMQVNWGDF